MAIKTRKAQISDVPEILRLMLSLAEFESYSDKFDVSADDLENIIRHSDDVFIFVADDNEQSCVAIAVAFTQPFTYDMKPWLILKEFIVDEAHRGRNVGSALFRRLVSFAREQGVVKIKWEVLTDNNNAKKFYEELGSEHQGAWQIYQFELA